VLVENGHLTTDQRVALAVEDGVNTLNGLLRRVQLAGHDPQQVLTEAISRRSLDDARQITNVLHTRITDRVDLDPIGNTFAEWTPKVDDPEWQEYLTTLARAADDRRNELGRSVAADPPRWAVEALGMPPASDSPTERISWETRAGSVAAYRELTDHTDEADPLGQPPKPGQVESYAAWRSAWHALGRPEADRAEAELSTGQLRVRIRAYDREKAWAPDYVADQLAGTRQAVDEHRHDAALWDAQAAVPGENTTASRLHGDAAESAALAQALDQRALQLAEADEMRSAWYAHTAETRAAAERAAAELAARRANRAAEPPPITAKEWLAAHDAEARAEDTYRPITDEHEFAETAKQRARDQRDAGPAVPSPELFGTSLRDIREEAAEEADAKRGAGQVCGEDAIRVPSADETAESVRRAQRALQELKQRHAADARGAEDDARDEVYRRRNDLGQQLNGEELLIGSILDRSAR